MSKDNQREDDQELRRLIRLAGQQLEDDFVRPSSDAIEAYLLGTADKDQRDEVRAAMLQSASFRKEMAELAEDLDRLDAPDSKKNFDSAAPADPDSSATVIPVGVKPHKPSILRYFTAAAAVLLVAISSIYLANRGESFEKLDAVLVTKSLDHSLLESNQTRGKIILAKTLPDGFEAALDAIRRAPSLFSDKQEFPAPNAQGGYRRLRVIGGDGQSQDFAVVVPDTTATSSPSELQVWILSFPQYSLYSVQLSDRQQSATTEIPDIGKRWVVSTWLTPDGYHSEPAVMLK